jgi:hypothetical protein
MAARGWCRELGIARDSEVFKGSWDSRGCKYIKRIGAVRLLLRLMTRHTQKRPPGRWRETCMHTLLYRTT